MGEDYEDDEYKQALGATHWAIFITVPDEFLGKQGVMYDAVFKPEVVDGKLVTDDGDWVDVEDITWWDLAVGACRVVGDTTYVYCPEFTYD